MIRNPKLKINNVDTGYISSETETKKMDNLLWSCVTEYVL